MTADKREAAAERVRKALAMRDAGYGIVPEPEDVGVLLHAYDALSALRREPDCAATRTILDPSNEYPDLALPKLAAHALALAQGRAACAALRASALVAEERGRG